MKKYNKPEMEEIITNINDIIMVSTSDEVLDYDGGFEETW